MSRLVNDDDNKVFLATAIHQDVKAGFVITWISEASLCSHPPKIILVVSKFNKSLDIIEKSGKLCLNLLARDQLEELFIFGTRSSSSFNKFSDFEYSITDFGIFLKGCSGYAKCVVDYLFETPDRKIIYCSVVEERDNQVDYMILSEVISRLPPDRLDVMKNKQKNDALKDEEQFLFPES